MVDWDGTGKHPILKMTREEILAYNEGVTERQSGRHAVSSDAAPQPEYEREVTLQLQNAEGNALIWARSIANNL